MWSFEIYFGAGFEQRCVGLWGLYICVYFKKKKSWRIRKEVGGGGGMCQSWWRGISGLTSLIKIKNKLKRMYKRYMMYVKRNMWWRWFRIHIRPCRRARQIICQSWRSNWNDWGSCSRNWKWSCCDCGRREGSESWTRMASPFFPFFPFTFLGSQFRLTHKPWFGAVEGEFEGVGIGNLRWVWNKWISNSWARATSEWGVVLSWRRVQPGPHSRPMRWWDDKETEKP